MRLPTTTLSLLAIAPAAAAAEERTYTDDLGVVHTTTKEKPTIVTFAHTAVSAFDYGELWTFAVSLGLGPGRPRDKRRYRTPIGSGDDKQLETNGGIMSDEPSRGACKQKTYHVLSLTSASPQKQFSLRPPRARHGPADRHVRRVPRRGEHLRLRHAGAGVGLLGRPGAR